MLAGGFPTIVQKMAEEVDWTEELGDAMLAQTDDLLDAVQRMRARAAAAGNLESNDAQVVETAEDDEISIVPADPEVVYVPSYDATAAYQPARDGAGDASSTVTPACRTGDILTTGAIAFGSALLIDEIFDDDDDDWDDYWRGPPPIHWDDDEIYPRRGGINADGDVNIDVDRDRNNVRIGDRDGPVADRPEWKPDAKQRDAGARQARRPRRGRRRPAPGRARKLAGRRPGQARCPGRRARSRRRPTARRGAEARGGKSSSRRSRAAKAVGAEARRRRRPQGGQGARRAARRAGKGDHSGGRGEGAGVGRAARPRRSRSRSPSR